MMLTRLSKCKSVSFRMFCTSCQSFEKEPFVRGSFINVNVAAIGDAGHGKTLMSSNISKVASYEFKPVEDFDKGSPADGSHRATHVPI